MPGIKYKGTDGQWHLLNNVMVNAINVVQTSGTSSADVMSQSAVTEAVSGINEVLTAHTSDDGIHLTSTEKTNLDSLTGSVGTMAYENTSSYSSATEVNSAFSNKVDNSTFTAHTASTTHMSTTEKTNLDSLATNIGTISGITSTDKLIHETMNRRTRKQNYITEYDNSANVNSFIIGGEPMWLNFDQRSRLKASLEAIEAAGGDEMTKTFAGKEYTFTTSQWRSMINMVENYAGACSNVTEQHRDSVNALDDIDDVEAYDYTVGYPQKINFDEMF